MSRDKLVEQLRRADAAVPPPRGAALHPRAIVLAASRGRGRLRAVRVIGGAAAAACLLLLIGRGWPYAAAPGPIAKRSLVAVQPEAASDAEVRRLRLEIARLDQQAQAALRRARQARELRGVARPRAAVARVDAVQDAAIQADTTAYLVVWHGQQLESQRAWPAAAAAYRDAIEIFPNTTWAALARERLRALQTHEGA